MFRMTELLLVLGVYLSDELTEVLSLVKHLGSAVTRGNGADAAELISGSGESFTQLTGRRILRNLWQSHVCIPRRKETDGFDSSG
jgi:hypothetical protein